MSTLIAPPRPAAAPAAAPTTPVRDLPGDLRIDGDVTAGRHIDATGGVRVAGGIDRAVVRAAGDLTVDGRAGAATLEAGAGIRLGAAHCTSIACAGSLSLTGDGATDCDIVVGGDLLAPGGTLRGGHVVAGGRIDAGELSGREAARLRIVMRDPLPVGDLVRVGVAHPGVEFVIGRELVRIDRTRRDLRIGVENGRAVVAGG